MDGIDYVIDRERKIKFDMNKAIYYLNRAIGEVDLFINLIENGNQIREAKERWKSHSKAYKRLNLVNRFYQKFYTDKDYVIQFKEKVSNLLDEYKNKIYCLEALLK